MKSEVISTIELYFPRILIREAEVTSLPDTNAILFYIKYQVSETDIEDEISINIEQ